MLLQLLAGQCRRVVVLIMHAPVGQFIQLASTAASSSITSIGSICSTSSLLTVALIFQVATIVVATGVGRTAVEHVK